MSIAANNQFWVPEIVYIEDAVEESYVASQVRRYVPPQKIERIQSGQIEEIIHQINASPDPYQSGKKRLLLRATKGGFFNQCPGTQGLLCCNYFVINPILGCNYDCEYCFLQGYLDSPLIQIVGNLEYHLSELQQWIQQRPNSFFRIGTGELGDSLSLDHILELAPYLISFFNQFPNTQLELKTKSENVYHLLHHDPGEHTIISFSLNPQKIIDAHEHGSASLESRLTAAKSADEAGYKLAFHFDPVVLYPGWEEDYQNIIRQLFDTVRHDRIQYISIGALRYFQELKVVMYRRFPNSGLLQGPFAPAKDGKWRYFRPVRETIFSTLQVMILKKDPKQWIYFCMEGRGMWKKIFNIDIQNQRNLDSFFKARRTGNSEPLLPLP